MWQRLLLITSLLLSILLVSTSGHCANVETDYDVQFDFGQLHYYQWLDAADNIDEVYATLPKDNIKFGLEQNLDSQLSPATAEHKADLLVRYYVRNVKKLVDDRPQVGLGVGGFGSNTGGGISFSFPLGGDNLDRQAQLVIDFLNPENQQLLWRGSLVIGMSSNSAQVNERQINKAAAEILKQFPPRK
jgi:hypothetical protein